MKTQWNKPSMGEARFTLWAPEVNVLKYTWNSVTKGRQLIINWIKKINYSFLLYDTPWEIILYANLREFVGEESPACAINSKAVKAIRLQNQAPFFSLLVLA